MPELGISETQFVFTYFHHYLQLNKLSGLDFIFPTLNAEGNPLSGSAGADLVIKGNIFFQFKMPSYLTSNGAGEIKKGKLGQTFKPYFRFTIKNDLLGGVPNTGQFDLLAKQAKSPLNVVKYISPIFEDTYSFKPSSKKYWFKDFFGSNSKDALDNFTAEIDIVDIVKNGIKIGNNSSHVVCYNFTDIFKGSKAKIFSDETSIQMRLGFENIANRPFNITEGNNLTIYDLLDTIAEDSTVDQNLGLPSIRKIQQVFISRYSIYWIPIILKTLE